MKDFIVTLKQEISDTRDRLQTLESLLDSYDKTEKKDIPTSLPSKHVHYGKNRSSSAPSKNGRHCRVCGKSGHRSDGCPSRKKEPGEIDMVKPGEDTDFSTQEEDLKPIRCNRCGQSHDVNDCETISDAIQRLKAKGDTSLIVASKLGIRLGTVNKHWAKEDGK